MATLAFNIAKGRGVELARNVDLGTPANSRLVVVVLDVGAVTDATLIDLDTLAAITGTAGVTERNTNGWTRKTLAAADVTVTVDDVNDRVDVDIPDLTWTAVAAAGGNSTDLVVCYDPDSTVGTDADLIPLALLDFAVTADGSDVTAQVNAAGFYRAA